MILKEKYGFSCMEIFDTSKTTVMRKLSLEDQWIFYINPYNGLHILHIVYHLTLVLLRRAVCRRYWKWFFRCLNEVQENEGDINRFAVFLRKVDIFELIIRNTCYLLYVLSLSFNPSHNFIFAVATHLCSLSIIRSTCYLWKALMGRTSTYLPLLKYLGYEYQ